MGATLSSEQFVGRQAELQALQVGSGAVVICGEAGVGKSRLVSELQRRAHANGQRVLIGECVELSDGELAYAPIVAALRPVLGEAVALEGLGRADRAELARLWPELGPGAADGGAGSSQARVFALLLGMLTRLGQERPVAFVIEDLQWADRSTRDFLAFLIRAVRDSPVSLLVTVRSEELHGEHPLRAFVAELTRVRGARRLELAPFSRDELAEQVRGILGEQPAPGLVARLFMRSQGNPFYTEELLACGDASELPDSLRDALMVRIERLSGPARRLVAVAATAERAVDERLLAAAGGIAEAEFAPALRDALGQGVLVAAGDGCYAFRHALVREVVYADLLASERRRLHRAIAQALVGEPELAAAGIGISGELAHHWHAAGELVPAFEASVRASAEAERALAFAEAHRHGERALELWERVPDASGRAGLDRAALLARVAHGALRSDQPERAVELGRRAIEQLADGQPARLVPLYLVVGRGLWLVGDNAGALAAYHAAVELVPAEPPSSELALALAGEAQALMLDGQSSESAPRCQEALRIARDLDDRLVEAQVLNTLAGLGWSAGDPIEHAAAGRRIASEIGALQEIGRGYVNGSAALDYAGRVEEAIALVEEGLATVEPLGLGDFVVYLTSGLAAWRLRLGQVEAAARLCAEEIPRSGPAAVWRHLTIGQLAIMQGALDEADAALSSAEETARGITGPEWLPPTWATIAILRLWQGRLQDAETVIRRALDMAADPQSPWLVDFADVYPTAARVAADRAERAPGRDGEAANAADAVARIDAMLAQHPGDHQPPRPVACRALAAAEAVRAAGRSDPGAWEDAAERFRALSEPYTFAYARYRQAEALLGARRDASAALRDAHAITTRLGERPLHAEIEALARRARIALDAAETADPSAELGVTARESQVLALLVQGKTNREIAEALVITEKTASVHVSHILAKLDARNRGEAAAIAHRLGLVTS